MILPWAVAAKSGNLQIPHNDAWSHSRIALHFSETGEIKLLAWNRSALFGQIFVMGPLAKSLFVQQTFVSFLALVSIFSIYMILKGHIGNKLAGISALLITSMPGFGLLSTQYMTDIPMFSAIFASLFLAQKSFNSDSKIYFSLAVIVSAWGVTVREQCLASLVSIFVIFLSKRNRFKNLNLKFTTTVFFVAILFVMYFEWWRTNLEGSDPPEFGFKDNVPVAVFSGLTKGWFNLGLILSVATILVFSRQLLTRTTYYLTGACFFTGMFFWFYPNLDQFFLPNYLSINGAYSQVLSPDVKLFSTIFWLSYVIFALVMGSISFAIFVQSNMKREPLLLVFSLLTLVGTTFTLATKQQVFDRYFIVFLPWILLSIFGFIENRPQGKVCFRNFSAVTSVLFILILSWAIMLNSFAFDSARWKAATELTKNGISPQEIDAGLEWVGWHSLNGAIYRLKVPPGGNQNYWSSNKYFGTKPCYVFSKSENLQVDGGVLTLDWKIVGEYKYPTFLFFGEQKLFEYETNDRRC